MSYEGYTQVICKKGHYWMVDCMMDDRVPCKCGAPAVWWNMVNQTNGCEVIDATTDEERYNIPADIHKIFDKCICGHIDLEQKSLRKCHECDSTLEVTYHIPKKGGRRS